MALNIIRQPQSTCVAPNNDARFALYAEGDIASYDWQYSADLSSWINIGLNSNTMILRNVQLENSRSFYRCKIEDSTDGTYIYSATVELFVFNEDFVRRVIRGGDMFLAMVDVYTSIRHQTTSDISGLIGELQAALNQKSSADHVHDTRYYRQEQSDDKYITDVSISDKTITFTYGDDDTKVISTQDYRVTNTPNNTTKAYITGTPTSTETTATQIFDTSIYLDTTAGHLVSPYFDGNALNDTLGQKIDETYLKSIRIDDKTITYTRGDDTTGTFTTQDYRVTTTPDNTTKAYLVGATSNEVQNSTLIKDVNIYLDTTAGHLVSPYFDGNALNDTLGQQIDETYIKSLSISDKTITYTRGDDTTGTITTQDYRVTNTPDNTTRAYITGTPTATESTATQIFDTSIYLDTTAGHLVAPYFDGNALNDTLGQKIDETYIKGLSVSDKVITYTKGDGTTATITTQDYRVQSVPNDTTKAYLVGSTSDIDNVSTLIKDTSIYLDTTVGHLVAPYFDGNALNDTLGQQIDETYIKGLSINDKTITYTRGDDTTGTITTQDYRVTSTPNNTAKAYLVGATSDEVQNDTLIKDTSIYLDTTAGHLTAPYFDGNALNDTLGQKIDETYIKNLAINDKTITYTRGDDTTGTITTQDYRVQNTPNATAKAYITGTTSSTESIGTQIFDASIYLDTTAGHLVAPYFDGNALNDTLGQKIDETYIKGLSINDKTITYTRGDDTTGTITTQDYRVTSNQLLDNSTTKVYLTGSESSSSGNGMLSKNANVYFQGTELHATKFVGDIEGAVTGTSDKASKDADGNVITETYVKSVNVSYTDGNTTLTYTTGDDTESTAIDLHTKYTAGTGLTLTNNREFSHPTSGVTAGTYRSVTVNNLGHVTAGTNPTTVSGYGITDAYTKTEVDNKISNLVNSAPETLDTLNELATALGNDPNFATTMSTELGKKVDKTAGIVGLSINGTTITYTRGDNSTGTISIPEQSATAEGLATARKIDGVEFDGTADITHYGVAVMGTSLSYWNVNIPGFNLVAGAEIAVKFPSSYILSTMYLNINSLGDIQVYAYGTTATQFYIRANGIRRFTYDGNYFYIDYDTYMCADNSNTTKAYLIGSTNYSTGYYRGIKDPDVYLGTTAGLLHATTFEGSLSGNATSATQLNNSRTIDGLSFDGTANISHMSTSVTQTDEFAYTVVCPNFTLAAGSRISLMFPNDITTGTPILLNVNGTGNTPILIGTSGGVSALNAANYPLYRTETYEFIYNSGGFHILNYPLVTSLVKNTTKAYLVGSTSGDNAADTLIKDTNVYLDTTAGKLHATTFEGSLSGNASSAYIIWDNMQHPIETGSTTNPVYFVDGYPTPIDYSIQSSVPANAKFTDTTYSTFGAASASANGSSGLVPAPTAGNQDKFLKADGTWANATYDVFTAASASAAGTQGLVPAPAAGDQAKFLRADKTWTAITPALIGASSSSHTHNYAGSSSAGGAATSADKINTDAGGTTQPVYFSNGVPVATSYALNKTVPSNAVFTDVNVTSTLSTTQKAYLVGSSSSSTSTGTLYKDSNVYLDTTAGYLTATRFNGPATKLTSTNVGSSTQGVYFDANGVPVAMSYSVNKTVPSNAVFTDTTYSDMVGATSSAAGTHGLVPAPTAAQRLYFLRGDGTWQQVDMTAAHQTSGTVGTGYYHRNIAYGTSSTPTSNSTYGGSGSIYIYYS